MNATAQQYAEVFTIARAREYPDVDAFERAQGFALDRRRLERAARILACPIKRNPPHWQHGRVIYAAACRALTDLPAGGAVTVLDIGTAKGFSALCLEWALETTRRVGQVVSVDVVDPRARVERNTVAELGGPLTLAELLHEWPEAGLIDFRQSSGVDWIAAHPGRIVVAVVDGKHTTDVVMAEGLLLADRQEVGDLVIFDDVQMPAVAAAVNRLADVYRVEYIAAPPRMYGVARRT